MQSPDWITLTHDEWIEIRRQLYALQITANRLFDVLKTDGKMLAAVNALTDSMEVCFRQENEQIEKRVDHYRQLGQHYQFKSVWSMLEIDDIDCEHPYITAKYVDWGNNGLYVEPIQGPTWLDLWRATDKTIERSGDPHHMFVENFELVSHNTLMPVLGS